MIRYSHLITLLILTLLTALGRSAWAQDSRVWIEVSSTVNSFTCESSSVVIEQLRNSQFADAVALDGSGRDVRLAPAPGASMS